MNIRGVTNEEIEQAELVVARDDDAPGGRTRAFYVVKDRFGPRHRTISVDQLARRMSEVRPGVSTAKVLIVDARDVTECQRPDHVAARDHR